jgi:polysaccharide export outer membrane protein
MRKFFLWCLPIIVLYSCVPKKDILYLQDLPKTAITNQDSFSTTIKTDDLIRIFVTSENMMAVKNFNLLISPTLESSTQVMGQMQLFAYLVDVNGFIEFPVLGSVKLSGLTIEEAVATLKKSISTYVVDPITVDLRILNYKFTILGEVNVPGTYEMESVRTTVLQALGFAGDLTIYGNRSTITLIREIEGVQTSAIIDLTSAEFLQSEFYYLQQNDVIVVHPNNAQVQSAGFNRNAPLLVSIASLLLSIIVIISRN